MVVKTKRIFFIILIIAILLIIGAIIEGFYSQNKFGILLSALINFNISAGKMEYDTEIHNTLKIGKKCDLKYSFADPRPRGLSHLSRQIKAYSVDRVSNNYKVTRTFWPDPPCRISSIR